MGIQNVKNPVKIIQDIFDNFSVRLWQLYSRAVSGRKFVLYEFLTIFSLDVIWQFSGSSLSNALMRLLASTIVQWRMWNLLGVHVKFNKFLHSYEHPKRIFCFLLWLFIVCPWWFYPRKKVLKTKPFFLLPMMQNKLESVKKNIYYQVSLWATS